MHMTEKALKAVATAGLAVIVAATVYGPLHALYCVIIAALSK